MIKTFRLTLTALAILIAHIAQGQTYTITGRIVDESDTSGLVGVNLFVSPTTDTAQKTGTATDENGSFTLENLAPGSYTIKATYIGFQPYERQVSVVDQNVNLGDFSLNVSATTLKNVVVTGQQISAQQKGDTSQFNANAFKVNPDANAEDLVTKMPGISNDGNTLKVNGEDVKQILVDGKPFFGDDPAAAMKNLPAEVIDRIQVFDRLSDQSQFSGFDDGNTSKTINIVTKPGRNNGQFGKIYGGVGLDAAGNNTNLLNGTGNGSGTGNIANSNTRYNAGGNVNFFKGNRRVSIIGLSNNINQQNFNSEDLLGVVGASSGQGRGGGGPRGGGRSGGGGRPQGGGGGGSDAGNFLVGQQAGITQTHALGLNYSDNWGKKVEVTGSYFFNNTTNNNNTVLRREYFNQENGNLIYNENSLTTTTNQNHRFNLRLEYTIDSFNSLILTPRASLQNNDFKRDLTGIGMLGNNSIDSRTLNTNTSNNIGYNLSNDLLYRHRFGKKGRSLSVNLGARANGRNGDGTLYSLNEYYLSDTTLLDQQYDLQSDGYTLSSNITYTEPITEKSQLMATYTPSYTSNSSNKETYDKDPTDNQYDILNPTLSNTFDNTYTTHRGGLSYRYNDKKLNTSIGLNGQYALLEGERTYPRPYDINRSFQNLLPQAMLNYKFTNTKNLRLMYRTNTNPPSITQLQDVVDNTNPLILKTGNPNLQQDYSHTLTARYGATNTNSGHNFFAFVFGNVVNNYIANATFIPTGDTSIPNGGVGNDVIVNRGSQLNMPVNLDGYYTVRSFLTYGFPVKAIKSNLNFNAGVTYSHAPSQINDRINYSNNRGINGGFTLGSNISENVDFTLNYNGNYTTVSNTLQTSANNSYYSQNTRFKFNWIFLKNFVFNTDVTHTMYTGLTQDFNQSFLLWNASLGYKFLKNRALDVRLTAFDILNQNRAISREITDIYLEDTYTNVLQRYLMLNVTYTLRSFGTPPAPRNSNRDNVRPQ